VNLIFFKSPVLPVISIHYIKVTAVAKKIDLSVFYSTSYGTSGLIKMKAIIESAQA
jgi:hypothetical protein